MRGGLGDHRVAISLAMILLIVHATWILAFVASDNGRVPPSQSP